MAGSGRPWRDPPTGLHIQRPLGCAHTSLQMDVLFPAAAPPQRQRTVSSSRRWSEHVLRYLMTTTMTTTRTITTAPAATMAAICNELSRAHEHFSKDSSPVVGQRECIIQDPHVSIRLVRATFIFRSVRRFSLVYIDAKTNEPNAAGISFLPLMVSVPGLACRPSRILVCEALSASVPGK